MIEAGVEDELSLRMIDENAVDREAALTGEAGIHEHVGLIQSHRTAVE